jgi:hypothetical protein
LAWDDKNIALALPGIAHFLELGELQVCSDGTLDLDLSKAHMLGSSLALLALLLLKVPDQQ